MWIVLMIKLVPGHFDVKVVPRVKNVDKIMEINDFDHRTASTVSIAQDLIIAQK